MKRFEMTFVVQISGVGGGGAGSASAPPEFFCLLKIRANSVEIWTKSVKTFTNALKIWAKSQKIQAKMAPNILRIEKNGTQLALIKKKALNLL